MLTFLYHGHLSMCNVIYQMLSYIACLHINLLCFHNEETVGGKGEEGRGREIAERRGNWERGLYLEQNVLTYVDPYLHVNEGEIGKPVDIHTMIVLFVNLHTYTHAHIQICM